MEYGKCPNCEKVKLYKSQAGRIVCGNRSCGIIIGPSSAEKTLEFLQVINVTEKLLEKVIG